MEKNENAKKLVKQLFREAIKSKIIEDSGNKKKLASIPLNNKDTKLSKEKSNG